MNGDNEDEMLDEDERKMMMLQEKEIKLRQREAQLQKEAEEVMKLRREMKEKESEIDITQAHVPHKKRANDMDMLVDVILNHPNMQALKTQEEDLDAAMYYQPPKKRKKKRGKTFEQGAQIDVGYIVTFRDGINVEKTGEVMEIFEESGKVRVVDVETGRAYRIPYTDIEEVIGTDDQEERASSIGFLNKPFPRAMFFSLLSLIGICAICGLLSGIVYMLTQNTGVLMVAMGTIFVPAILSYFTLFSYFMAVATTKATSTKSVK